MPIALTIEATQEGPLPSLYPGVIGIRASGNDPAHLRELAVGDVREDLRLRDDHVAGPIRPGAGERAVDGLLLADVLNGIGRRPDGTGGRGVVAPGHALGIEQVRQRGMFEARILGRRAGFAAGGIDHRDQIRQGSDASGGLAYDGIFGGEQADWSPWAPTYRKG